MTTLGSLFTGYGGLDMGVMTALDPSARVAWTSDIEAGPCKLAATRWPDTPNLGDITAIDWANVEPADIICGGHPARPGIGADLALPREQQLRLLGNGVVPQQATLAVRTLTETALRFGATS